MWWWVVVVVVVVAVFAFRCWAASPQMIAWMIVCTASGKPDPQGHIRATAGHAAGSYRPAVAASEPLINFKLN